MIFDYVEMGDGNRHVHVAHCDELTFQREAGDVFEVYVPDDLGDDTEDEIICLVWFDFIGDDTPDEDELDHFAGMTVFRRCAEVALGWRGERSGNPKADDFADAAEDAGWSVDMFTEDGHVRVRAQREFIDLTSGVRGDQVLELVWSKTRLVEAHHLSGLLDDVAKKLSSVKGALDILASSHPRSTPKTNGRHVDRDEPVKRVLKESIPFDIENAYDDEILDACRGRKLVWWNDTAEDYEMATVIGKNPKHYKIETGTAGRAIISFISAEGGWRSVALENLVQVK
jgi:hypothetical protein